MRVVVSRAPADAALALEVERVLREAGYEVQPYDGVGSDGIRAMHDALAGDARVVALLSPAYLADEACAAQWQNALAGDPLNTRTRLVLLRVAECEPPGLLAGIAYWDLASVRRDAELLAETIRTALDPAGKTHAASPYWRASRSLVDPDAILPAAGFTGRDEEIAQIDAALADNAAAVIYGLGGIGKSSLAREYAWRNRERYAVEWWLNAETEDGIVDGLLRLGRLFSGDLDRLSDRRSAAQQVVTTMLGGFAKPVLLIFDNLEDERLLNAWRPRGAKLLVTSRDAALGGDVVEIPLHAWSESEAIAYVRRESRRPEIAERDARALVEALGALPLALAHAAAYLRTTRTVTIERYLAHIAGHLARAPRNAEYPRSVFATFTAAIAAGERQVPGCGALLSFAACFAPEAIPDELFRQSSVRDALPADTDLDEALGTLDRLSLLAFAPASRTYTMHRLVQLAALDVQAEALDDRLHCAVAAASALFPPVESTARTQECERLANHVVALVQRLRESIAFRGAGPLATRCAEYLRHGGGYATAERLLTKAIALEQSGGGADRPELATTLLTLANVYKDEGRYAEAEPLFLRALAIRERVCGAESSDCAEALNDLATSYFYQGRDEEAEPLFARALTIFEKTVGAGHKHVFATLGNLALNNVQRERYAEAEALYRRCATLADDLFPADSPSRAWLANNFGMLYAKQNRNAEAEPLFAQARTILEQAFGPEHPDVAWISTNLAAIYERLGRDDEAEALFRAALAVRESSVPGHPSIAHNLHGLAKLAAKRGRFDEAAALYQRAIELSRQALEPGHPLLAVLLRDAAALSNSTSTNR